MTYPTNNKPPVDQSIEGILARLAKAPEKAPKKKITKITKPSSSSEKIQSLSQKNPIQRRSFTPVSEAGSSERSFNYSPTFSVDSDLGSSSRILPVFSNHFLPISTNASTISFKPKPLVSKKHFFQIYFDITVATLNQFVIKSPHGCSAMIAYIFAEILKNPDDEMTSSWIDQAVKNVF